MDVQTKIKAYCECEIMRARVAVDTAGSRYLQTLSAYDLSLYNDAQRAEQVTVRCLSAVLDLMAYHDSNGV